MTPEEEHNNTFRCGVCFGCGWVAGYLRRHGMHEAAVLAIQAWPAYLDELVPARPPEEEGPDDATR
jgi:hypothetical protein